jgi:Skp family chaperone for outer membrane proteins
MPKVALVIAVFAGFTSAQEQPPSASIKVVVCNIALVFSKYEKAIAYKKQIEAALHAPKKEAKRLLDEIDEWTVALKSADLKQDKDEFEEKIFMAKQKLDDLNRRAQALFSKKLEENQAVLWKEVQGGIQTYAVENKIDIVLGYGDPVEKERRDTASINRKMQAMDLGGTVPLFASQRADISYAVADLLNRRYDEELKKANRP